LFHEQLIKQFQQIKILVAPSKQIVPYILTPFGEAICQENDMKIILGSKNPIKLQAVQEVLQTIPRFAAATILAIEADSGVSDQPCGLEETIRGAQNRSKEAFIHGDMGIGLESGIIPVPLTQTGYMNLTACAIFEGRLLYTGLGPAFELPQEVADGVANQGLELDQAVCAAGMSDNPRIGYDQGIIGIMTRGRITRMEYSKPAVLMALAGMTL
jgi:inosine/xanthosine triphosphatase